MKYATAVALVAILILALSAGAALAADIVCSQSGVLCSGTSHKDTMHGTPSSDSIFGKGGNDTLYGKGAHDHLYGDGSLVTDANMFEYVGGGIWKSAGDDVLYGGPGDDHLFGYNGDDKLNGGSGNDKISALDKGRSKAGKDHVLGSLGNDSIIAHDGFADVVDCGHGKDFVYYDKRLDRVAGNCERRAWPPKGKKECLPVEYVKTQTISEPSPMDYLSIRRIVGTDGNDTLVGTDHGGCLDVMVGRGGDDTLRGRRGVDDLEGGPGSDTLGGGPGNDGLFGGYADPTLPLLTDGSQDTVYGGEGNDFIDVLDLDQTPDTVSCGDGDDWAIIDGSGSNNPVTGQNNLVPIDDVDLTSCERVDTVKEPFFRWFRWLRHR